MKKASLVLISLIVTLKLSSACADFSEDITYYNLFDQTLAKEEKLHPFLVTFDYIFYDRGYWNPAEKSLDSIDYNIVEWQKFFDNQISSQDLKYIVYQSTIDELNKIINSKSTDKSTSIFNHKILLSDKGIEALKYLVFAKTCEPFAVIKHSYDTWSYMEGRGEMTKSQFMKTAKDGNILYAATKNNDLKLRIAYQLVRLSHYGGFNDDAVRYFNTYVVPLNNKSLIYYYALEQKAGALYNQKKYANAAQNYIEVFNNTPDRQLAVYTSFLMNNSLFANAENTITSKEEKATLYMLRAYHAFSNGLSEMKKIYNLLPNSSNLEIVAIRELNNIERHILELPAQYDGNNSFLKADAKTQAYLSKLILFTETLANNKSIVRKDFWKAYLAHLYFVSGNYTKSESTAKAIQTTDDRIKNQATITAFAAFMASKKTIDANTENTVYDYLNNNKDETVQGYIYEVLGNRYLKQKSYAKAFLCHNDFSGLYKSLDIQVINDLITFYNQPNKNKFETELCAKENKNALSYLYELKGTYYLKNDDLENALIWFKKIPPTLKFLTDIEYSYENDIYKEIVHETEGFNGYSNISPKIFSNGIRPYFEDDVNTAMTDVLYKTTDFSFIPDVLNKLQLTEILIKLKKMSAENNELSAKANYLLGNYYYNISAFGYFRNIMYYETGNYYLSNIYSYTNNKPNDLVNPYNYNGGTGFVYQNQLQKSFDCYMKTATQAINSELKARATFQASKIELDNFYIKDNKEQSQYYYPSFWEKPYVQYSEVNRPLFKILKTKYADTKYFAQIKSNCLYFKYYLNN